MPANPPDTLLFVTPGCPHCNTVLQGLGELVKQGAIGKMTVVNVAVHPEEAAEYGARTAPWLRMGIFTLTGAHSLDELRQWAAWAGSKDGVARYVEHLLKQGSYKQATAFIAEDPQRLEPLLPIIADPDAGIDLRLGVSALLEAHAGSAALQRLLPQLGELARHTDRRVRADACHLLGLTGSVEARQHVEACLADTHAEVREIAEEAMQRLEDARLESRA